MDAHHHKRPRTASLAVAKNQGQEDWTIRMASCWPNSDRPTPLNEITSASGSARRTIIATTHPSRAEVISEYPGDYYQDDAIALRSDFDILTRNKRQLVVIETDKLSDVLLLQSRRSKYGL